MPARKKSNASPRKRALIVWGGWPGHTPESCAELFGDWLRQKGFRVVVSDSLEIFADRRRMRTFDVVMPIWTMGELSDAQWAGLRDAVLQGTGVAGFHGGMCDAFRVRPEYQFMTGGQWVAHPGNVYRYQVNLTRSRDPVTRGLSDFWITSEQYYMHTDPSNDVLATTTFSGRHGDCPWIKGTVMPYVWKRTYGKGRIFYHSAGHTTADFEVPEAFEIQKRGILWAARAPVRAEFRSP